ncbi:MAG: hypothetical protein A3F72_14480 [Bacteroidetes bacterium RIFCSPLOWO2_12_FULL_35_15]|nr:MAG: hypothetical protein A3F72_14480 [Bacteroidetes bacterium RIFCSPLOWO2_12_FULL_35_15]
MTQLVATEKGILKSYLTFQLNEEKFAVNVGQVIEIVEVPNITKIPNSPTYLLGVINLRGSILPVVDARIKFGLKANEYTVNTCILVLQLLLDDEQIMLGALVDAVNEVFDVEQEQIQPFPAIGTSYKAEFIKGVIKDKDQFVFILNIDKVFSVMEMESIKIVQENIIGTDKKENQKTVE